MKVLVVGATSVLGSQIAAALVVQGVSVVETTTRDVAPGDSRYRLDVVGEHLRDVMSRILREHPDLDGFVYLPAISRDGPLHRIAATDWSAVMEVNFLGAVRVTQALIRHFVRRRSGVLMYVSSTASMNGEPGAAPYACSKSALNALAKSVAREYARFGVNAYCVLPGYVEDGMSSRMGERRREEAARRTDVARFAGVDEIARFCAATVMNATYLSGNLLSVDGGLHG